MSQYFRIHPDNPQMRLIHQAVEILRNGGVIAYPTEAVYGLGCDPLDGEAVKRLLALKQRPEDKGLILIAAEFSQLAPYVEAPPAPAMEKVLRTWPGPTTWLQRVWNTQPDGRSRGDGMSPGTGVSGAFRSSSLGRAEIKPCV